MAEEMFSWQRMCRTWGSNSGPLACQVNSLPIELPRPVGEGEVRVLGRDGELRRRLGINQDGSFLFSYPDYIAVNPSGEKIFVSNLYTDTITCMTTDGRVVYRYKDNDMKSPRGLYCDSGDTILVCGRGSNNVQVITADGKKNRTLLINSDGLDQPYFIVYRETDDTRVVGCKWFYNLYWYKLAK